MEIVGRFSNPTNVDDLEFAKDHMILEPEEAQEFQDMTVEDKSFVAYAIWKKNGFRTVNFSSEETASLAVCSDPRVADLFDEPDSDSKREINQWKKRTLPLALSKCSDCPLIAQCLTASVTLDNGNGIEEYMVYGGTNPEDRQEIYETMQDYLNQDIENGDVTID